MKLLKAIGLVALLLCCLAVSGCWGPEITYRYRLTIEVDTPDGLKTGSSVIETTLQNNHDVKWGPARYFTSRVRGEAVFVDLGSGRHIIALLAMGKTAADDVDFRTIVPASLGVRPFEPKEVFPAPEAASVRKDVLVVPERFVPTIVRFRNLDDPTSFEIIEPAGLQQALGAGYALRRATVQLVPIGIWPLNVVGVTGVPVTTEIHRRLRWIDRVTGYLNQSRYCNPHVELCVGSLAIRRK